MIGNKLPSERRNFLGTWAIRTCKSSDISNSKIAKSVVSLALELTSPPNDLVVAQEMAPELFKVIGILEIPPTQQPLKKSEIYCVINDSTKAAVASSILQLIESIIVDMDWVIVKLKNCSTATQKPLLHDENREQEDPCLALEEVLDSRAEAVVKVLSSFWVMNLEGKFALTNLKYLICIFGHLNFTNNLQILK